MEEDLPGDTAHVGVVVCIDEYWRLSEEKGANRRDRDETLCVISSKREGVGLVYPKKYAARH